MAYDTLDEDGINGEYNGIFNSKYLVPTYDGPRYDSVPQSSLGAPTSIQTANQIAEATSRLNAGVFGVDLALINPEILDQIPKQHMKEIDRLVKLSGAKASMHGPIVDLAGFEQGKWDEMNRRNVEKKLGYYIERAHELDEDGNTPINFHINTNIPGEHWRKLSDDELDKMKEQASRLKNENDKAAIQQYIDRGEILERLGVVDQETGQVTALQQEVKRYPRGEVFLTPEKRLEMLNRNQWDEEKLKIFELVRQKDRVEEYIKNVIPNLAPLEYGEKAGVLNEREKAQLAQARQNIDLRRAHINELNQHVYSQLNEMHHRLKFVPDSYKKQTEEFIKDVEKTYKVYDSELRNLEERAKKRKSQEELAEISERYGQVMGEQYERLQLDLERVGQKGEIPLPERFVPTNELAKKNVVETVSNAIYENYKKFKENTPIITIENYWHNQTLGSASELKSVIEESRKKFAEKLVKNEGLDREEAKEAAEKLIGVTWDVGHINFMRSLGYNEKDILEETKKIGSVVKQVHITDNFGYNDSHLPPGMGNAPIKKELEILEKQGFRFDRGNVIVEAGAFAAQMGENPHAYALEYFNTPLYSMKAKPNWYNIWETQGPYNLGYGDILPDIHFRELYGAGFSNLPSELGGQRGSPERGRFGSSAYQ